uniref:Peptidase C1A papain C-terminal domain-containing protein n=1 Tax=Ananas comosus var. bracteatus TaxID=296719 RepID=A0A6V7QLC8_ANACO|nr:unnamed protein product [Ananas comosus var. bracteatus]
MPEKITKPNHSIVIVGYGDNVHYFVEYGGSCWSFATSAAIEGLVKIKNGHLIELSPQYIMDGLSKGCDGGSEHDGWEIVQKRGVVTERAYPYVGCSVPFVDEHAFLKTVAYQPVACNQN